VRESLIFPVLLCILFVRGSWLCVCRWFVIIVILPCGVACFLSFFSLWLGWRFDIVFLVVVFGGVRVLCLFVKLLVVWLDVYVLGVRSLVFANRWWVVGVLRHVFDVEVMIMIMCLLDDWVGVASVPLNRCVVWIFRCFWLWHGSRVLLS